MKKRFLAIFIVVIMLFSQITVFASVPDSSTTSINPEDKLTDELKEVMSNTPDGEYIPIEIDITALDDSAVYKILSQRLGENITADTEEQIIKEQIETKIEQYNSYVKSINDSQISVMSANARVKSVGVQTLRDVCEISSVLTNDELTTCINEGMPIEEIIELSERNQFLSNWRSTRKELNTATNNDFVANLNSDMYSNLYIDPALTRLTMNCKKEYIISIASFSETEKIGLFVDEIDFLEENLTTTSSNFQPYHMTEYNDFGYNGNGIKIGILEASADDDNYYRFYDTSNVHLAGKTVSYRPASKLSQTATHHTDGKAILISQHATTVMSIISGTHVTSNNGNVYGGIAPNATLSLTHYLGESDIYTQIDWLINTQQVNLINISAGGSSDYDGRCANIDNYIQQYRVIIIKSDGNSINISSPGMSYNLITVGNVGKLTDTIIALIDSASSFNEPANLTNKPDICAIGTNIYMLNTSYNPEDRGFGTSFAAPQVTGTVALMLQKNSSLIGNPHKVKSILLSSADESAIYKEDDDPIMISSPTTNTMYVTAVGITREKTGAGLLNVEASISNANNPMLFSYNFSSITHGAKQTTHSYYSVYSGQTIKFGGVFEIDSGAFISNSQCNVTMNLRIIELDGTIVFDSNLSSASSWNDNVKMFTVNFASGGLYKFELYFSTRDEAPVSGFENNINATMIVTCMCENPLITKERESGGTNECIDCANCSYYLEEIWYGDVHEETLSTGTVSFVMQYDYDNLINPTSICCSNFSVEFEALDPSLTVAIIPETGNKSYTPTGWTEYRKYMIMIYDPNSSAGPTTFYVDVTIGYDSFALTYYLYG